MRVYVCMYVSVIAGETRDEKRRLGLVFRVRGRAETWNITRKLIRLGREHMARCIRHSTGETDSMSRSKRQGTLLTHAMHVLRECV